MHSPAIEDGLFSLVFPSLFVLSNNKSFSPDKRPNMPAPTALLKPEAEPSAAPIAIADVEDEVLIDSSLVLPEGSIELQPTMNEDTDMVIDEEGRPRFAPAKDIVRNKRHRRTGDCASAVLIYDPTGPCRSKGVSKSPGTSEPDDSPEEQLDEEQAFRTAPGLAPPLANTPPQSTHH